MGLKDRLAKGAARASELARDAADSAAAEKLRQSSMVEKVMDSAPVEKLTDTLAGLKALIGDEDERAVVVERPLVTLVRTVRDDDDEPLTDRDLERAAKRRAKR